MANGNGKKKKKKIIIFSIIGIVVIVLVALVILGSRREPVITVQTEKVQKRTLTQIVTSTGKIQPEVQVKINAEVSGEIIELPVREGQQVKKGQLLVRIKPDAFQAQYESAQATLEMANANLRKSEAEYKRNLNLFEKKLISDSDIEIANAGYLSAKATFDQANASLKQAHETFTKTTIKSPMTGVVSQLISELGERVSGSNFTQGTEIMTIADLSTMEARVDVGENDIVLVSKGDIAKIEVDSYPDQKFTGIVSQIANTAKSTGLGTADQVTNFEVRIRISPPEGVQFRPGMSMSADIQTETRDNVLTVPIQSVTVRVPKKEKEVKDQPVEGEAQLDTGKKKKDEDKLEEVVFVVKDGVAKTVPVKRGISDDTYVEVKADGLEGQEVVSGPFKAINRDLEVDSKIKIDNKSVRKTGAAADKEEKK
jgi:HlyD family secretion protein